MACFSRDFVEDYSNVDDDVVDDIDVASIVWIVETEASVEIPRNDLEFVFLKIATAFLIRQKLRQRMPHFSRLMLMLIVCHFCRRRSSSLCCA